MSVKNLRRVLLFAPLVLLAVACSGPTGPKYPDPNGPDKPGQNGPSQGAMQPATPDTLNVPAA